MSEDTKTIRDLVTDVCGPLTDEEVRDLLWSASSYPFGDTDSIRQTLSESWEKGGKTVNGAIGYSHTQLDDAWNRRAGDGEVDSGSR